MKLLILGDLAVTRENECQTNWDLPLEDFSDEQKRILLNWEFPIGTEINPIPRASGDRYLTHPLAINVIKQWGPGFASLATNHMLDANSSGIDVTIKALRSIGFVTVGAGNTQEEITYPLVWETNEGRLTVINWVFSETHPDWNTIPGVNCWPGLEKATKIIEKARQITDWLILILHWSDELFAYPRPEDRVIAETLAASGVDGIICHHPHVVRGKEVFHSIPVYYSIGNFYFSDFFDYRTNRIEKHAPRNHESLGILISFSANCKPVFETVSFWQQNMHTVKDKNQRAEKRLITVSKPLVKYSRTQYEKWYTVEKNRFEFWGVKWDFVIKRLGVRGLMRYLFRKICNNVHSF